MRLFVLIGVIVNNDYDWSMIQERRTKGSFNKRLVIALGSAGFEFIL